MTGFDKLTEKIINDANKTAEDILANANAEIARIEAEYAKKKENAHNEILSEALGQAESLKSSVRTRVDNEYNEIIKKHQDAMISDVVEAAANEIVSFKEEKYISFMAGLLAKVLISRIAYEKKHLDAHGENISPDKYVLVLRKKDRDALGEKIIAAMRRATVGKIPANVLDKVVLSSRTASMKGGFILEAGDLAIDVSMDALIEHTITDAREDIAQMLFGI